METGTITNATGAVPSICEGEVLSPSQARTFLSCAAKWYFRYVLGLREPKTGSLAVGSAFHKAITENFRRKIASGRDLPLGEVAEIYDHEWQSQLAEADLRDDEDRDELHRVGAALTEKYLTEAAATIQPAAVEQFVEGVIGGVKVQGYVDLLDTEGRIIDLKTAAKKPTGISHDYAFQLTSYTMITPGASGECRLDTITKTKTIQIVQEPWRIGADDRRYAETMYPMVQDGMRTGLYIPNRAGFLCSRRYCGYWRRCEREYGGTVKE
jgi:CRISPR/Cas system-associated exonuclease Cas4 (RecB family)